MDDGWMDGWIDGWTYKITRAHGRNSKLTVSAKTI
jgi:hypothetical protein